MIDDISLQILQILQKKARIPNVEVARQVGMAPSAVLERIRKLEKKGIIDGYEVQLNPERFKKSLISYIIIRLQNYRDQDTAGKSLAEIEDIQEVHFVSGEDSFLVKIRASDTQTLADIIEQKIRVIPSVKSTKTLISLRSYKETSRFPLDKSLL